MLSEELPYRCRVSHRILLLKQFEFLLEGRCYRNQKPSLCLLQGVQPPPLIKTSKRLSCFIKRYACSNPRHYLVSVTILGVSRNFKENQGIRKIGFNSVIDVPQ